MDDLELQKQNRKRYIIYLIVIGGFFFFCCWHIAMAYDLYPDAEASIPIFSAIKTGLDNTVKKPFDLYVTPSFRYALFYGILTPFIVGLMLFNTFKNTMFGKEHGTGRWGTSKEKAILADADEKKNMIMTNDVKISMNTRKTRLNNNILIVGGSGSGKTRFFAKPNIAQANCSFVVTDPKGELLKSTAQLLEAEGFKVLCFNLIEKQYSCCYNPFFYIHKEDDIFKLITQLIKNTTPMEQKGGDPFWEKSEILILEAIFFYLWLECPKEEQTFKKVMELLSIADASEEDENKKSQLDIMFEELQDRKGEDYIACKQYNLYKKASGKTAKSILISVGARLSVFNLQEVSDLTITDTLHLEKIGDRKTVLYIVIPDSDGSFNFLVSMLYSQLFNELYFQADFGELKWENNKILFRSKESLYEKKSRIESLYEEYRETKGDLKRESLRNEIVALFKEVELEFGLPFLKIKEKIPKTFMSKYLDNLDECYLRLNDKVATLKGYYGSVADLYQMIKFLYKKEESEKNASLLKERKIEIAKLFKKLEGLENRVEREFGLTPVIDIHKKRKWNEKKPSNKDTLYEIKKYLLRMKSLIREIENSSSRYGTRQSFDDKCQRIEEIVIEIKHQKELIKETSTRQGELRKKYYKNIQKYTDEIKSIELIAEYEFGIKNLESRKANGGRLPIHVRCILDEFANIAPIPDFSKLVATMRSREISVSIILQNISQLKEMYKENWESLMGNCDSFLFLGGQEQSTLELVSKKLGKRTIDKRTSGTSKGSQGSSSENWDNMGREVMFDYEIGKMDNSYCILFIRGLPPFLSKKFKLEEHPCYGRLGDTDNPADKRLFPFKEKFDTKAISTGMDMDALFMNGEMQKILRNKIDKLITCLDLSINYEVISGEKMQLLSRNNVKDFNDATEEKRRAEEKQELYIKRAKVNLMKIMNNSTFDIETIDSEKLRKTLLHLTNESIEESFQNNPDSKKDEDLKAKGSEFYERPVVHGEPLAEPQIEDQSETDLEMKESCEEEHGQCWDEDTSFFS